MANYGYPGQQPHYPPQGPPGYYPHGYQPPGYPMGPGGQPFKPHRSSTVLVLGLLGFLVCGVCGIVAWTMGNADLREMDAGIMDPAGRGETQTGRTLGMISTILTGVALGAVLLMFIVGGFAFWRRW